MFELGVGFNVLHTFNGLGLLRRKGCTRSEVSCRNQLHLLTSLQKQLPLASATKGLLECMALRSSTFSSSQVSFSPLEMGLEKK